MSRRLRIELDIPDDALGELGGDQSPANAAEHSFNDSVQPEWIHSTEWVDTITTGVIELPRVVTETEYEETAAAWNAKLLDLNAALYGTGPTVVIDREPRFGTEYDQTTPNRFFRKFWEKSGQGR